MLADVCMDQSLSPLYDVVCSGSHYQATIPCVQESAAVVNLNKFDT